MLEEIEGSHRFTVPKVVPQTALFNFVFTVPNIQAEPPVAESACLWSCPRAQSLSLNSLPGLEVTRQPLKLSRMGYGTIRISSMISGDPKVRNPK
jgi:hypothetical protein